MKIWYQYPGPVTIGNRGAVFELLETVFQRVKRPDSTIDIMTPERGGRPNLWPHAFFKMYSAVEVFESIQRAERDGYDGVVIGQSAEPVLIESKETLGIPITGISESGVHLANQLGAKFGLVTIPSPAGHAKGKHVLPLVRNVQRYGLESHLVGTAEIAMPPAEFSAAIAGGDRKAAHQAVFEVAKPLIEQGAEVIIPAETLLSIILAVDGIVEVPGTGAAVIDLVTAGIKNIEMLIDMHKSMGLLRSRSLTYASPNDVDIEDTLTAFGRKQIANL